MMKTRVTNNTFHRTWQSGVKLEVYFSEIGPRKPQSYSSQFEEQVKNSINRINEEGKRKRKDGRREDGEKKSKKSNVHLANLSSNWIQSWGPGPG